MTQTNCEILITLEKSKKRCLLFLLNYYKLRRLSRTVMGPTRFSFFGSGFESVVLEIFIW